MCFEKIGGCRNAAAFRQAPHWKKEEKEGLADYLNDDLWFVGKIGVCHWLRMNCVADLKMMGEAVKVELDTNENKPLYLRMTADEEMRHYKRLTELIGGQ